MVKEKRFFIVIFLAFILACNSSKKNTTSSTPKAQSNYSMQLKKVNQSNQSIQLLEYPIGHPNVSLKPLDQLRQFPLARYKKNHSLPPLFNWMDLNFLGGKMHPNYKLSNEQIQSNHLAINKELATQWNYYFHLGNVSRNAIKSANNPNILFANKHPQIPISATTLWTQLQRRDETGKVRRPHIFTCVSNLKYVLKNDKGEFFSRKGQKSDTKKIINFTIPNDIPNKDGLLQAKRLKTILSYLTRPINIINENGEAPPFYIKDYVFKHDAESVKHKNKLGFESWDEYKSTQKTRIRKAYLDQIKKQNPRLKNTIFSWYSVEGGPADRFDWNLSKSILSKVDNQYYSTPNFYPKSPEVWSRVKGPFHGWQWIEDGRKVEIKAGDKLFSPFVAAGWYRNPEKNIRPGQWLGLLKCLGVVGATFYYTGHFSTGKAPFPKPEDYIWQAVMPTYAQAITSHYESILRTGDLLLDRNKKPIVRYPVEEQNTLLTIRKHANKKVYVISGAAQTTKNTVPQPPLKSIATFELNGYQIKLPIRRQGSTYILDFTQSQSIKLTQLDAWHQAYHPHWWSKDYLLDCSLFDSPKNQTPTITDYTKSNNTLDFSTFSSYKRITSSNQILTYTINAKQHKNCYIFVRARSTTGGNINLSLNDEKANKKIDNRNWEWIKLDAKDTLRLLKGENKIFITSIQGTIEIDKIFITQENAIPALADWQL